MFLQALLSAATDSGGPLSAKDFWANRGKKSDFEFWANRGKRSEYDDFFANRGKKSEGPQDFFAQRGKKLAALDDFFGSRGKKSDDLDFWGSRGKRESDDVKNHRQLIHFWAKPNRMVNHLAARSSRGKRSAIDEQEEDMEDEVAMIKGLNPINLRPNNFLFSSPVAYSQQGKRAGFQPQDPNSMIFGKSFMGKRDNYQLTRPNSMLFPMRSSRASFIRPNSNLMAMPYKRSAEGKYIVRPNSNLFAVPFTRSARSQSGGGNFMLARPNSYLMPYARSGRASSNFNLRGIRFPLPKSKRADGDDYINAADDDMFDDYDFSDFEKRGGDGDEFFSSRGKRDPVVADDDSETDDDRYKRNLKRVQQHFFALRG
jgi:hypothetical protein